MRTLASIQVIDDLSPIAGADRIELAQVMGWQVVVGRGEFVAGDTCVFCEIDSVLPPREEFSFLAKSKYRVKTIKLRGALSQGLCLPLSVIPDNTPRHVGMDVTETLGVTKYTPPVSGIGGHSVCESTFPACVPKTDEPRVQSHKRILRRMNGLWCYVTKKLDGTSCTFASVDGEISVCSRTRTLRRENDKGGVSPYWRMYERYNVGRIFESIDHIAIQGEMVGHWHEGGVSQIQGNRCGVPDTDLFVFDVYDLIEREYFGLDRLRNFCEHWGLKMVPLLSTVVLNHTINELLEMASITYDNGRAGEGIVIRTVSDRRDGHSFKVINNQYLLKHGDA
jgi:RNA ligase (TIGR02306 family)